MFGVSACVFKRFTLNVSQNDEYDSDKRYFSEQMQQLQALQVCSASGQLHSLPQPLQADEKRLEAQQKEMSAELARMREALVRSNVQLEQVPAV